MVMKKIFDQNFDEEVHSDFLKYGKGDYKNKYLLEGKRQATKWAVKTGPEFANFLVKKSLEKCPEEIQVKGIIVSTIDLRDEINFEIVKVGNFQGIRKTQINTVVKVQEIKDLMEKYPRVFFALSFKGDDFNLKIKAKAPKASKPGKGSDEGPRAEFCTLKTKDKSLVDELFFDHSDFKEIRVSHRINITDIVYPDNLDSLKPTEVREQSKRKGIITRTAVVDGEEKISEANFVA
jgi:hypothetical protein